MTPSNDSQLSMFYTYLAIALQSTNISITITLLQTHTPQLKSYTCKQPGGQLGVKPKPLLSQGSRAEF